LAAVAYSSKEVYIAKLQPATNKIALQQLSHGTTAILFQNNTIPSLVKLISINRSPFCWWWLRFHQMKSTPQPQPSIIKRANTTIELRKQITNAVQYPAQHHPSLLLYYSQSIDPLLIGSGGVLIKKSLHWLQLQPSIIKISLQQLSHNN
jgi:hypothetical protein